MSRIALVRNGGHLNYIYSWAILQYYLLFRPDGFRYFFGAHILLWPRVVLGNGNVWHVKNTLNTNKWTGNEPRKKNNNEKNKDRNLVPALVTIAIFWVYPRKRRRGRHGILTKGVFPTILFPYTYLYTLYTIYVIHR